MEKIEAEVHGTIKHESSNPIKVEVTRGQKGSYGWTISISGTDIQDILADIKSTDAVLRADFPQPEGG